MQEMECLQVRQESHVDLDREEFASLSSEGVESRSSHGVTGLEDSFAKFGKLGVCLGGCLFCLRVTGYRELLVKRWVIRNRRHRGRRDAEAACGGRNFSSC